VAVVTVCVCRAEAQPAVPLADTAAVLWADSARVGVVRDSALGIAEESQIKVVRRRYKYREQVKLALFMMGFIALILTATQNWNPD